MVKRLKIKYLGLIALLSLILVAPATTAFAWLSSSYKEQNDGQIEAATDINEQKLRPIAPESKVTAYPEIIQILEYYIEIPKIGLVHNITANVNSAKEEEYLPAIEANIAHGKGTALPQNPDGNVYLFAHSKAYYGMETPDGAWFTRIDELQTGDQILIHFNGKIYTYTVVELEIISPSNVSVYTGDTIYTGNRSLILQTCYPRGDQGLRLIVKAKGE